MNKVAYTRIMIIASGLTFFARLPIWRAITIPLISISILAKVVERVQGRAPCLLTVIVVRYASVATLWSSAPVLSLHLCGCWWAKGSEKCTSAEEGQSNHSYVPSCCGRLKGCRDRSLQTPTINHWARYWPKGALNCRWIQKHPRSVNLCLTPRSCLAP